MLKIITGRAGSGKSEYCSREFAGKASANAGLSEKLYFIVPEQFTIEAERRILDRPEMKGKVLLESEVLSFKRLVHRILSRLGGGAGEVLTKQGRALLLASVLSEKQNEIRYFKNYHADPGKIIALLDLIDEFETYNRDRRSLEDSLEKLSDSEKGVAAMKYGDLLLIYRAFREKSDGSFLSGAAAWETAAARAEEAGFFRNSRIWIDEFSGFTDTELKLMSCMLSSGADVTVSLCTSGENEPVFYAINRTLGKLKELAAEAGSVCETLPVDLFEPERGTAGRFFREIERQYTKIRSSALDATEFGGEEFSGAVVISAHADRYAETLAAAKRISSLRESGMKYGDIAVAMRNTDDYAPYIVPVFNAAGIPFFLDDVRPVISNQSVAAILAVLNLYIYGIRRRDAAVLLKSGIMTPDRETADELENVIMAKNLRGPAAFRRSGGELSEFAVIYDSLKDVFSRPVNISAALDGLTAILRDAGFDQKACETGDRLRKSGFPERADEFDRIWDLMLGIFAQIGNLLGSVSLPAGKDGAVLLKNYIHTAFAGLEIGFIPQHRDAVNIAGTGRSRVGNPKAMIILGVNEGVMPAGVSDSGLLSGSERGRIEEAGIGLADNSVTRAYKELFMIYSALFAPSEKLYLSYCRSDGQDSREMFPSAAVIKKIKTIVPWLKEASGEPGGVSATDAGPSALAADDYSVSRENTEKLAYGDGTKQLSITQIESYNSCPFRYFLDHILRIRKRDTGKFESNDYGTLLHAVLETAARQLSERFDKSMDRKELDAMADELAGDAFDRSLRKLFPEFDSDRESGDRVLMDRLKRISGFLVRNVALQYYAGSVRSVDFETSFGNGGRLPPVTVVSGDGERVEIGGKIDRIDVYTDGRDVYVNVIDYKSSKKDVSGYDLEHGLDIQLVTYLKAVSENDYSRSVIAELAGAPGKDVIRGAGLYFVFENEIKNKNEREDAFKTDGDGKTIRLSGIIISENAVLQGINGGKKDGVVNVGSGLILESGFKDYSETVDKVILNTADAISSGRFAPEPRPDHSGKYACRYCAFRSVCGLNWNQAVEDGNYQ